MGFWSKFVGNTAENVWKESTGLLNKGFSDVNNLIPTLLTGGMYNLNKTALKTGGETMKDYQYRNAGKQADQEMLKSKEAAGLAATQQAQQEFDKNSKLASMAYGAGGGTNLQSFTNKSQTKKSILGSF